MSVWFDERLGVGMMEEEGNGGSGCWKGPCKNQLRRRERATRERARRRRWLRKGERSDAVEVSSKSSSSSFSSRGVAGVRGAVSGSVGGKGW